MSLARVGSLATPWPPAVQSGAVFVAGDHAITGLDAGSGATLWQVGLPNAQITARPVALG